MTEQEKKAEAESLQAHRAMQEASCGREKYWSELSIEEKIARMRLVVKSQADEVQNLRTIVSGLVAKFEAHSHEGGRVMIPSSLGLEQAIGQFRVGKSSRSNVGDDCYF